MVKKYLEFFFLQPCHQAADEIILHPAALFDDGLRLFGAGKLRFAAVAQHRTALQKALLHQLVHIHRDKVRLDVAHFHDIAGGRVAGVVGKEHQDIKRCLRQVQLLAQRLADGAVRKARLVGKFHTGVQLTHCAPFFLSF